MSTDKSHSSDTGRQEGGRSEQGRPAGDEEDFRPQWPRRPQYPPARLQPRPRLDPPEPGTPSRTHTRTSTGNTPPSSSSSSLSASSPSKWTSYPTAYDAPGGESKETRLLPVVEPPRPGYGSGRPRPGSTAGYTPAREPETYGATGQSVRSAPDAPAYEGYGRADYDDRYDEGDAYESYGGQAGYADRTLVYRPDPGMSRQGQGQGRPVRPQTYNYTYDDYAAGTAGSRRPTAVRARKQRTLPRWLRLMAWVCILMLGTAAIGAMAFGLAWQSQYAGKIYPGVRVLDTDLGGKTPEQAKELLGNRIQAFLEQPVVLVWGGKEWRPGIDQIGVKVELDATVDQAFRVGRSADIFANAYQQWLAARWGYTVPVVVQFSEPTLQTYLDGIASSEINQELFEGDVRLNGAEIVAMPGKEGRTLRTYDAIKAVREVVAGLEPGRVELPVEVVQPTVSAQEVEDIRKQLAVRISGPITATSPARTFTLDRDALVRFTTIERNPDRTAPRHIELGWKEQELKTLGERWAAEATRPARNARFAWNDGALAVLSESVDGFETDPDAVIRSIKEHSATTDQRQYQLPGRVITPTVSSRDIGALGIKELIGSGSSTFVGSSRERATNIRVAANLLNGAVVPPGDTFSFLQTMGGIDEEHGFVEGYVIAAERTQRGVGGGVCQVSTTTFRAAFWSGVNIIERNQHSYRVGWYEADGSPVGFDAAVFDPGVDLKFVNNTPGYILIEAAIQGETLRVNFYGTKPPGEVKLEGPFISNRTPPPPDVYQVDPRLPPGTKKQVETARAGLDVVIVRRIVRPGQEDIVDRFASSYKAWPNWYIVASASQIPGGSASPAPPATPTPNP